MRVYCVLLGIGYNKAMENIFLKQVKDSFIYGYTGKIDNVISLSAYRINKNIQKFGNNPVVCTVTAVIFLIAIICTLLD